MKLLRGSSFPSSFSWKSTVLFFLFWFLVFESFLGNQSTFLNQFLTYRPRILRRRRTVGTLVGYGAGLLSATILLLFAGIIRGLLNPCFGLAFHTMLRVPVISIRPRTQQLLKKAEKELDIINQGREKRARERW